MITQPWAIAISVALFVLTIAAFWFFTFYADFDSLWLAVGVPVALLLIFFGSLFWSLNDNFYDVKSGVVIDQSFTPAHQTPPTVVMSGKSTIIVPGVWVSDDWAIEIKGENGQTGWIHFNGNIFAEYPDGSSYP